MDRAHADYMGMLATVINSLALQDALESRGSHTRVLSAIEMERAGRAVHPPPRHPPPRKGAAGDLRRRHRQSVLHDRHRGVAARDGDRRRDRDEGDQVDGVYDKDPHKLKDARMFRRLSYLDVLNRASR